jgi:hypothetical protein
VEEEITVLHEDNEHAHNALAMKQLLADAHRI